VATSDANPKRPTFERVATLGRACLPRMFFKLGVRDQDVDDVVQETLIEVGRGFERFDPALLRGRREEADGLRAWLWGFACRAAAAYHRRMRQERAESIEELPEEPADEGPSLEQVTADEQRLRLVAEVLSKLPTADVEVLVPFHFGGMTTHEIAEPRLPPRCRRMAPRAGPGAAPRDADPAPAGLDQRGALALEPGHRSREEAELLPSFQRAA
jgi:RNA polymerase sigma factor (sigma-70 family)